MEEEEEEEEEVTAISQAAAAASPSLPLKTRIAVALISTVTDASRRHDGTVNRRLLSFLDFRTSPNPTNPINGIKTYDVTVDSSRNLWYRVFVPSTATITIKLPVMVFFHGGGFAFLSADSKAYDAVCRRFARKIPSIVISVNYRLSPEHRFPSQYDDGFDVLKFLDDDAAFLKFNKTTTQSQSQSQSLLPENADLSRCFLAGDSAGGNIAHHVAKRAATHYSKFHQLKVMGLVAIQPFFGGEERTESEKRLVGGSGCLVSVKRTDWLWKAFMPPEEGDRDHEVINVSGPRAADISVLVHFPATLVFVGGLDPLQDWQRSYYHWLKSSGKEAYLVDYPNTIHAFYVFPELPLSAHLISQVKHFLHKHSSSSSSSSSSAAAAAAAAAVARSI